MHKNLMNLMVKTVCESDIQVKNYSEKTKRNGGCMHASGGKCMLVSGGRCMSGMCQLC